MIKFTICKHLISTFLLKSGAGVEVGMLRGAGDSLTWNNNNKYLLTLISKLLLCIFMCICLFVFYVPCHFVLMLVSIYIPYFSKTAVHRISKTIQHFRFPYLQT